MSALNLRSKALYEEVAELLRQRIFTRELEPGHWIDEIKLTQELGISRTPLREALKVLASEGLVTIKLRRGAYVTEVSEKDLRDVYHLLGLLESDATACLAQHITSEQLEELQHLCDELQTHTHERECFFALNEKFHLRILEMSNNRWRLQMVLDLRKVMKLNRHHSLFKSGRIEESLKEHLDIMHALHARNSTLAAQMVLLHFAHGLQAAT